MDHIRHEQPGSVKANAYLRRDDLGRRGLPRGSRPAAARCRFPPVYISFVPKFAPALHIPLFMTISRLFRPPVILVALVAAVALLACAPAVAAAQADVIRGRVTNIEGEPLPSVRVSATSTAGNVTREARTNQQGGYQIVFPGAPGDYIMGFFLPGYDFRQFELKRLADEAVLVADARLSVIQLDTVVVSASIPQRVPRGTRTPDVSGTERTVSAANIPPEQQGNLAAMAASLPGVVLVPGLDGDADGFSVLGLGADQNAVTLNGMPVTAGSLPRDAAIGSSLATSPMDPSRGGFSGGALEIGSRAGSNFRTRGVSLVMTSPQVQWTDPAARALGNEYTSVSVGGIASGPIRRNKSFYNLSYELARQSRDHQTLLSASDLGLRTAGIAPDSVARLLDILRGQQVPLAPGAAPDSRLTENGTVLGSIDISPPSSSTGQSFGLTANGHWRRTSPLGAATLHLPSAGGERTGWGGGLQARHSGYFGLTLVETSAGVDVSGDSGEPFVDLPAGWVRVSSVLADGGSAVQNLGFGGNQALSSASRSSTASFRNSLSWFDAGNKHRLKLSTELLYSGNTYDPSTNLLGSFTFNSLADLEVGRPASFSRTLSTRETRTGVVTAAISLGDSWRRTENLQIQYGLRVEASRFTTAPEHNPQVQAAFGRRNERLPSPVSLSPRLGFSWTVGQAQEIATFAGAARRPRAVVRGGVGVFTNSLGAGQVASALEQTGLPGGAQQLLCVGPAAPAPEWGAYADDPSAVPDRCADGGLGTPFANRAPNVTLFAPDFRPHQSVRSHLSWNGAVLRGRMSLNVEGTYSLNHRQQRMVDLNFDADERFTLADEDRPVFVQASAIIPGTGSASLVESRVSSAFSAVNEVRSDLQWRTAQLSLRLSPVQRGRTRLGWNAAYTFSHIREQASGFSSTAGNPLRVESSPSAQGRHQVSYGLRYDFLDAVQVNWTGWFRSGNAFTPMVAGDVNGDGSSWNDRAFVYSPGAADAGLATGMRDLLDEAPEAIRRCLREQLNSIAARNSCRGPWTSGASLIVTLDRAKFRLPQRGSLSLSVSNPLGAADLLLNGSGNLRGWGQNATPEQTLLYVRGFDPAARRFRYEVNPRFGSSRPQVLALRTPVAVTLAMRMDLGPMRERQSIAQQLSQGRDQPGSLVPEAMLRSVGSSSVQNPLAAILREQDSLRLSAPQADSIAAMNRRYTYRTDSLWTPVARELAGLPKEFLEREAYRRFMSARRTQIEMLMVIGPAVRELLTSEQRRKLAPEILSLLDRRYLASIRNGTGTYLGNTPASPGVTRTEFTGAGGETVIITTRTFGP